MFEQLKYNWKIYQTLKRVSKQRCALILQPVNVWVIERALSHDESTEVMLRTCYMRGWVEPLVESIPTGELTDDHQLPPNGMDNENNIWKLTDSGWNSINRTYQLTILSLSASCIGLLVAIAT